MTLKEEKLFCCVCKKLNVYETVTDFSPSVQHDLDGRPHGEERYALTKSIQVCPYCRYANFSVDTEIEGFDAEKVVHSGEFLERAKKVSGAKKFILSAYLYEKARDFITAGYLYMNAAWTFDDENAKNSRTTLKLHEKSQGSNEETKNSHISARTFDDKIDKKRSSNASYTNETRTFDHKISRNHSNSDKTSVGSLNAARTFDDENAKNSRTTSKLHEKSQGSNEETKNSHISARTFDDKIDKKRSSNASYTNETRTFDHKISRNHSNSDKTSVGSLNAARTFDDENAKNSRTTSKLHEKSQGSNEETKNSHISARTFDDKIDRERLKSIEVTNENQNLNEKHSQSVHSKDFKGENDEDCAKYFRIKAAECFAKGGFSEDTAAAHCDCLRRTGDFKAARTFAKKALKILRPEGELYDSLKIEIDLCRKKDDSCKVFVPRKKGFFGFFRGKKK